MYGRDAPPRTGQYPATDSHPANQPRRAAPRTLLVHKPRINTEAGVQEASALA